MKQKSKQKPLFFYVMLIGLLLGITACGASEPKEEEVVTVEDNRVPVEVAHVEKGKIDLVFVYSGNLESVDDINVFPEAAGKIKELLVEEGDVVKTGDPIAIIESDVYEIQLKQAKANVKNAQLQLAKMTLGSRPVEIATAQAAVQLARAALEDVSKIDDNELTKAAANIARAQSALRKAQSDYDKIAWAGDVGETREALALEEATIAYENALASYNLDTTPGDARLAPLMVQVAQAELNLALTLQPFREIDFAIAKAGIEQAEVGIEMAQLQLDNTVIEAPFDGIVAELNIAKGSNVGPQVPIARFVTQAVEVKVNVEESRIGLVKPGQFAAIRVPAFPGKDFAAVVTTISPVANKDTRTFSITVMPQDDEGVLRGGMFANVSLLIDEKDDTILTPLTSITLTDNDKVVYVVTAEQTVVQRTIVTGIQDNERIEILSGLEEGDTVVVAGQPNLIDGALVEVVNEG
jgi:HlyD family secretion protein